MPTFFDLQKYAATGISSADMSAYDKARALAAFGGGKTQTLTDVPPLSFKANGKPLISWSMLGAGSQSETPTPDAPIMPQFCGVRTANLYFKKIAGANISDSGVITALTGFDLYVAKVEQGVNYSGNGYIYAFYETEPVIGSTSYNDSRVVSNLSNVTSPITGFVAIRVSSAAQNVMCNTGSSVLPYEPSGYKIPITCAGQTTPVYLGQTQTVRKIWKRVLDGTENWRIWALPSSFSVERYYISNITNGSQYVSICTHFPWSQSDSDWEHFRFGGTNFSELLIFISKATAATAADFKTYLQQQYAAGTPVTVWYVLSAPETAIVNEPLAKIGAYADELHSADAGVSIPTAKGQNTLTVDTELQPSEMTITYKG